MRGRVGTTLALLAAVALCGAGCQLPASLTPEGYHPGTGLLSAVAKPEPPVKEVSVPRKGGVPVAIGPPRRLPDLERSAPVPVVLGDQPVRPVVWRASSAGPAPRRAGDGGRVQRASYTAPCPTPVAATPAADMPRELSKVTLPPYVVEPPDVLIVELARAVPRPPYRVGPLDELTIQAPPKELLPGEPIAGLYAVDAQGRVDLAHSYGRVTVAGLTEEEAAEAIRKHLAAKAEIKPPRVTVAVARTATLPTLSGERRVRPDGTISLGVYGDVSVAGLTLAEAKAAIQSQLARRLLNPEVSVDVACPESKAYYVVLDNGRQGQRVVRVPAAGGETVLDALSRVPGLPPLNDGDGVWVARPAPDHLAVQQVLAVDWSAITRGGGTGTNYQLFPGDRVYVRGEPWPVVHERPARPVGSLDRLLGRHRGD
jgi:protein involved in polysaccharide export with SLBB domain